MYNIILPSSVVILTIYAHLVLRLRLNKGGVVSCLQNKSFIYAFTDFWVCSSIAAFFLSYVCWSLVVADNTNVAKIYPVVTSTTVLFVSFANFLVFQDRLTFINMLGGVFILLGIFLLLK